MHDSTTWHLCIGMYLHRCTGGPAAIFAAVQRCERRHRDGAVPNSAAHLCTGAAAARGVPVMGWPAVQVLKDIADPDGGIYSFRDPMESRLSYVRWQMENILEDPMIKVSMLDRGARASPPPMHFHACCAYHAAPPCMQTRK